MLQSSCSTPVQVSFIIPVFNQLEDTDACLNSLRATTPEELRYEVLLVDDASAASTRDYLSALPSPYRLLRNEYNLGYAKSNNRAAQVAQGEFLALLNNDLILQPGWLEPMLAPFLQVLRVGVVGNVQLDARTGEVDHAGVIFRDGGYPVHVRETLAAAQAHGPFAEYPSVTAACCLVRREWFLRVGGFDEGYRNGFEDTDLCLRAREDGLINVVATQSVVLHHISRSQGRGAYEYRNASRFLRRWSPRTSALEQEWDQRHARAWRKAQAEAFFRPFWHRLGIAPPALYQTHRAVLAAERRSHWEETRPLAIGIDLLQMLPGGANGGVKPLVFSFLKEIGAQRGTSFTFVVFAAANLKLELEAVLPPGHKVIFHDGSHVTVERRLPRGWRVVSRTTPTAQGQIPLDVLYAPFGHSSLMRPDLPCVSLIVDLLHRDLSPALPIEEIHHRHAWFTQITQASTYFQCISQYVAGRLQTHYGIHPTRCFHTYIPAHERFLAHPTPLAEPLDIPDRPFFYYPANFWLHKNHESLLLAYRLYLRQQSTEPWSLVFTGHPEPRSTLLQEMSEGLGLDGDVHFLGHLPEEKLASLWRRAGALVFPSLHEGFGIPLIEAMYFDVPIICSDATALPEIAADAALLVNARDPAALAESMLHLASEDALRANLVRRGQTRLKAFSLAAEAGRLAHFLESAARRKAP